MILQRYYKDDACTNIRYECTFGICLFRDWQLLIYRFSERVIKHGGNAAAMLNLKPQELTLYGNLFRQCDLAGDGKITGLAIKDMFKQSGLPGGTLKQVSFAHFSGIYCGFQIWDEVAQTAPKKLYLTQDEFFCALRLIAIAQLGLPVTAKSLSSYQGSENLHFRHNQFVFSSSRVCVCCACVQMYPCLNLRVRCLHWPPPQRPALLLP